MSNPKAALWFLTTGGKDGFADRQATPEEREILTTAMENVALRFTKNSFAFTESNIQENRKRQKWLEDYRVSTADKKNPNVLFFDAILEKTILKRKEAEKFVAFQFRDIATKCLEIEQESLRKEREEQIRNKQEWSEKKKKIEKERIFFNENLDRNLHDQLQTIQDMYDEDSEDFREGRKAAYALNARSKEQSREHFDEKEWEILSLYKEKRKELSESRREEEEEIIDYQTKSGAQLIKDNLLPFFVFSVTDAVIPSEKDVIGKLLKNIRDDLHFSSMFYITYTINPSENNVIDKLLKGICKFDHEVCCKVESFFSPSYMTKPYSRLHMSRAEELEKARTEFKEAVEKVIVELLDA